MEPIGASYRFWAMAVNPDPKPGRWILPLVILGMIAFTYFFVKSLPEASPDTTLAGATSTTAPEEGSTTTQPGGTGNIDDATQAYLDELSSINDQLSVLNTELVAVNDGFDADPREIEFGEAETRMETVANDTQSLSDQVAALTAPTALESNQQSLVGSISVAAQAAGEALSGLRSTDTGELRRAAVAAYTSAVSDFGVEVENTRTAAGVSPSA